MYKKSYIYTCCDVIIKLSKNRQKAHLNRHFQWSRLTPEILLISCHGSSYSGL